MQIKAAANFVDLDPDEILLHYSQKFFFYLL